MEWQTYASFRPIGERAADVRMASLLCMIANMMRKKGSKELRLEQFLISREPKEQKIQTADEMDAVLQGAFDKQGASKHGG